MLMVSPSLTLAMLSSQSVRYMHPVSSPIRASQTVWGAPSLPDAMLLTSLFETTFALTFTALEVGVNSPTFTSTDFLPPEKPSTAKSKSTPMLFARKYVA